MTYSLTDLNPVTSSFREDVLAGMHQTPKTLECKYLYDKKGVQFFNKICTLKDYYITRLENEMLRSNADAICAHIPDGSHIIEYGSGSADKIRFLFEQAKKIKAYTAIDISMTYLKSACENVSADYPHIEVRGICGDYMASETSSELAGAALGQLPGKSHGERATTEDGDSPRVVFFPGSTIGNLEVEQIHQLIRQSRSHVGKGGWFFLGADLVKPLDVLKRAYNDDEGVTAQFNLNLLHRINNELDGTFNPDGFRHEARWNTKFSRIEMHLVSNVEQKVSIAGEIFHFRKDETIFTESSHKFTPATIEELFSSHGYQLRQQWHDPNKWFGHFLFQLNS